MAICKAFSVLWVLLHLNLFTILAFPTTTPSAVANIYDVAIIGGGPAGLAAAMSLGRIRRSAILIDSAVYRNAPTREMHDVLGNDGTVPSAFRAFARQEISAYSTVKMTNGIVTAITPATPSNNNSSAANTPRFQVSTLNGPTYTSRRVILATGMRDVLPSTPGLAALWGTAIYWCTWCDGWEHRDKPFANLTPFSISAVNSSITSALTLNPGTVLLTNGTATPDARAKAEKAVPGWEARLKRFGVRVEDRVIARFGWVGGDAAAAAATGGIHDDETKNALITFTDNTTLTLNAIKASFPAELVSPFLPTQMGLKIGTAAGGNDPELKVVVDDYTRSSLPGVYAVGDMNNDGSSNVVHALWSAKRAVVDMHGGLGRERADEIVAAAALPPQKQRRRSGEGIKERGGEKWEDVKARFLEAREEGGGGGVAVEEMMRYVRE